MAKAWVWMRNGLAVVGLVALGFWLGAGRTVRASDFGGGGLEFQLTDVKPSSALLVYQPAHSTVYVYQGATTGNAELHCSFMFELDRHSGTIHRENCAMGSLTQ